MYDPDPVFEETRESGTVVKVFPDWDAQHADPRGWDNVGTMIYWGRDYLWADEQRSVGDWAAAHYAVEEYVKELHEDDDPAVVIPLRFNDYGASGADVSACDLDDANGLIWCDQETVRDEFPGRRRITDGKTPIEQARACLEGEVETYSSYIEGEVYGYVVEHPDIPEDDSCWGFVGEMNYCKSEAIEAADHMDERVQKEHAERDHWAARGVPTN